MKGVESASFLVLGNNYAKDKQTVFFENKPVTGAHAAAFVVVPGYENTTEELYFAKDDVHVFWKDKIVSGADPATFQAIEFGYGTDKNHVFYKTSIMQGADPKTFRVYPHGIGDANAEDKNNRYMEGKKCVSDAGQ